MGTFEGESAVESVVQGVEFKSWMAKVLSENQDLVLVMTWRREAMPSFIYRLFSSLLIVHAASADTLLVPTEYATIQEAIDAANTNGDEIVVAPGVYFDPIDYSGKAVYIRSQNGNAQTFIDVQGSAGPVVRFANGEDINSVLDGFTIRNSTSSAIEISGSGPALKNLRVLNCSAIEGAAVRVTSGNVDIDNSKFLFNYADRGGAIHLSSESSISCLDCVFELNEAGERGGAIYATGSSVVGFEGCAFNENFINRTSTTSDRNAFIEGGAIFCGDSEISGSSSVFSANSVRGNYTFSDNADCAGGVSTCLGGAISVINSDVAMSFCEFDANSTSSEYYRLGQGNNNGRGKTTINESFGGAVSMSSCVVSVVQCQFLDNTANALSDQDYYHNGCCGYCISQAHGYSNGGAFRMYDTSGLISSCQFLGNRATVVRGDNSTIALAIGGAVALSGPAGSSPTITGCQFENCSAEVVGSEFSQDQEYLRNSRGGAIHSEGFSSPFIDAPVFVGCSADWGGAYYAGDESSPFLVRAQISSCSANFSGGAICSSDSFLSLVSSVVANNSAGPTSATPGGGIYSTNQTPAARPSVAKSIFCGNTYGPDVAHIGGPYYDDGGNSFAEVCGEDCNRNQLIDEFEILFGLSDDCDANGVPDECDVGSGFDCNMNGVPDACDLLGGDSADCDANGLPDECDEDCNGNGSPDICDVKSGLAPDCDGNGLPDECDIADGSLIDCNTDGLPDICGEDCNGTGLADECDIESGDSLDCDTNGVPDECDPDCDTNGIPDVCDIEQGDLSDCDQNSVPDVCEPITDCNQNGVNDPCEIVDGDATDNNGNGVLDECECPADVNGDSFVNYNDLLLLLSKWDSDDPAADIDGSGSVGLSDLLLVLANYGECP